MSRHFTREVRHVHMCECRSASFTFSGLLTVLRILGLPNSRRHAELHRIPDAQFKEQSANTQTSSQRTQHAKIGKKHVFRASVMSATSPAPFPVTTTGDTLSWQNYSNCNTHWTKVNIVTFSSPFDETSHLWERVGSTSRWKQEQQVLFSLLLCQRFYLRDSKVK